MDLTAERFIDNPYVTDADQLSGFTKLYKTGEDVGRWLQMVILNILGK